MHYLNVSIAEVSEVHLQVLASCRQLQYIPNMVLAKVILQRKVTLARSEPELLMSWCEPHILITLLQVQFSVSLIYM